MSKIQIKRSLEDLVGAGKAVLEDFKRLNIESVNDLAIQDPEELYGNICTLSGETHCICVKDVFYCTVAQAINSELPYELCQWHTWSRLRKEGKMQEEFKKILQK